MEKDPFEDLPDELILLILSKITEAKHVCYVSMVSTRFASLTFFTQIITMSINIPSPILPIDHTHPQHTNGDDRPGLISSKLTNPYPTSPILTFSYLQCISKFLTKFTSLQSLIVRIPCTTNVDSIIKWTLNIGPSEFDKFLLLVADKKTIDYEECVQLSKYKLLDILMGYKCLSVIVANSKDIKLKRAVITDRKGLGEIYVEEAHIVELKNTKSIPSLNGRFVGSVRSFSVPDGDHEFKDINVSWFSSLRNIVEEDTLSADISEFFKSFEKVLLAKTQL